MQLKFTRVEKAQRENMMAYRVGSVWSVAAGSHGMLNGWGGGEGGLHYLETIGGGHYLIVIG